MVKGKRARIFQQTSASSSVSAADIGTAVKRRRKDEGTRKNYRGALSCVAIFLNSEDQYKDCFDSSGCIKVPFRVDAAAAYFGALCKPGYDLVAAGERTPATVEPYSVSTLTSHRAAIVDLYEDKGKKLEPELNAEINGIINGYEKVLAELRLKGLIKLQEGRLPLPMAGLKLIANKGLAQRPRERGGPDTWHVFVFIWCFLVLMWNLLSRSDSVDKLMLAHIMWSDDSLLIEEQCHKGDKRGKIDTGSMYMQIPMSQKYAPCWPFLY